MIQKQLSKTFIYPCNGIVSTKIFAKQDDFDIDNFPFFKQDIPQRPS